MSKLETASRLSSEAATPQLQVVQEMSSLQRMLHSLPADLSEQLSQHLAQSLHTVSRDLGRIHAQAESLKLDMHSLPAHLVEHLSREMSSLTRLPEQVQKALQAFDQVNKAQRQALDELTQEQRQAMAQSVSQMDSTLQQVREQVRPIEQLPEAMHAAWKALNAERKAMAQATQKMQEAAEATRPKLWKQAIGLMLAGIVTGLVVLTGQVVLSERVQHAAAIAKAAYLDRLWDNATPKQREAMDRIASQPEP